MTDMTESSRVGPSRRAFLGGVAAAIAAAPAFAKAPGLLRGAGDFRAIKFVNSRTEEYLDTLYWVDGAYIPEALAAIDHILRDWRQDLVKPIAPATVDILSAVHNLLDGDEPFEVVSGYRSPATNRMLRRRSRGVARKSYHTKGMAVDVALKSRSVRQMAAAGRRLAAGGVGQYTRSSFVHYDSGPVRDWGR